MTTKAKASKVAAWIDRLYRQDRLNSEPGRRERIIADRVVDLESHGVATISRHDSVTGKWEELRAD